MRIAVDMDDTLSLFVEKWIEEANYEYSMNVNYLDIAEWDIEKYVPCTSKQIYDILDMDGFFLKPEVEKDAKRVIDRLKEGGHDVFVVTATYNPKVCEDKAKWLFENVGIQQHDIIYAIRKELIQADMLIDDGSHNIRKFNGTKVVFNRPHNQDLLPYEYDVRIQNWKQLEIWCEDNGVL